ncbi:MAG: hypothetical protein AABZ32_08275, partial [Bacteroidota bacterium]
MARIIYPDTLAEQRILLDLVTAKHIFDAAHGGSALTAMLAEKNIDLAADAAAGTGAAMYEASSKLFMRDAENNVQQRDLKFDPVFSRTRGEVQFLKTFLKPNVRRLGEWGITVDGKGRINYPSEFIPRVTIIRAIKTKHDSYPAGTSPLLP